MVDFIVEPGGDTVITLTKPNVALSPALPTEETPTPYQVDNNSLNTLAALQRPVTYLVSSKQLMAASPVFNVMLTRWREGTKTDGRFHIGAEEWDVIAMLIFLKIIHKTIHGRSPPRRSTGGSADFNHFMSLERLVKLALIVDYYDAGQSCDWTWVKNWIRLLPTPPPHKYRVGLQWWMFVAIAFRLEEEFKEATWLTMVDIPRYSFGGLDEAFHVWRRNLHLKVEDGLPIPHGVLDKIYLRREVILTQITTEIKNSDRNIDDFNTRVGNSSKSIQDYCGSQQRRNLLGLGFVVGHTEDRSIRDATKGLSFVSFPTHDEVMASRRLRRWFAQFRTRVEGCEVFPPGAAVISCESLEWSALPMKHPLAQHHELMDQTLHQVNRLNGMMQGLSLADFKSFTSDRSRQTTRSGGRVDPFFIPKATVQKRRRSSSTMEGTVAKRVRRDG